MKYVQYPSIVNFHGAYTTVDKKYLWVVMELMDGPSLAQILDAQIVMNEYQMAKVALDVCLAF